MKLSDYAKLNGISYRTAWNWYKDNQIPNAFQAQSGTIIVPDPQTNVKATKNVIYSRVSNASCKEEMKLQTERCITFATAKGLSIDKVYSEVASGMNDKRKQLLLMLESNPTTIIVEHKDRLTRFGFNYLELLLKKLGTEIIVINRDHEDESDLVKDMISIVTSFCCRLYGLRRGQNKVNKFKQELENE